jgi:arylsulfatase A-like enzyme
MAVSVLLPVSGWAHVAAGSAPNIVVIMADDLGYADVGFNGCRDIPTPRIDSIAANGIRFSSAYATYSVCGPSRAGFLTGRYQQRFGFERNPQYRPEDPGMGLPLDEQTLAEALKKKGYVSGIIGKWDLGAHDTLHPCSRGFDYFFGHLGGGHDYFPENLTITNSHDAVNEGQSYKTWILRNHTPVRTTRYLTDEFSDEAAGFIERSRHQPFFLFLSYNAPHTPMQATGEYLQRFPDIENTKRRTYAAMVSAVDDGVGRVLDTLRDAGLEEKTLVFFLSDNGGPEKANASDNGPLRGQKSDVWEGGFRIPFALSWPGTLAAGRSYDHPVSALDIFATATALAGAAVDPDRPTDGVNLIPCLTGKESGAPHDAIFLRKYDQQRFAVRRGEHKLVIPAEGQAAELYNLAEDIGETRDIRAAHPEKAAELEALLKAWDEELIPPRFLGLIHLEENIKKWGRPRRW